jgi:hypothetical protein
MNDMRPEHFAVTVIFVVEKRVERQQQQQHPSVVANLTQNLPNLTPCTKILLGQKCCSIFIYDDRGDRDGNRRLGSTFRV